MKILYGGALVTVVALAGLTRAQTAKQTGDGDIAKERLIWAWYLVHMDVSGPDGKPMSIPQPKGMLIYTRDGHMSVQLMYSRSANARSNEYVKDRYEASFGSYDVDEATHMLTHHVQGSITRDLIVGKDLPRISPGTGAWSSSRPSLTNTGHSPGHITEPDAGQRRLCHSS